MRMKGSVHGSRLQEAAAARGPRARGPEKLNIL